AVGVATGVLMAGFNRVTETLLFARLLDQPLAVQVVAPTIGLVLAYGALRWVAFGATNSTSNEYVAAFHRRHHELPLRQLPGKLLAGAVTMGLGGALGLE